MGQQTGKRPFMRPGIIVAIVAALVVIVGVWWVSTDGDQATVGVVPQDDVAVQEEPAVADDTALATEDDVVVDEETIVVGDPMPEDDTIVVTSPAEDAVILDADAAPSVEMVDEAEPAETAAIETDEAETAEIAAVEPAEGTADTAAAIEPADEAADTTADTGAPATGEAPLAADAEELLTPANFDADEVLVLIDTSEQLTEEERSTLRALVEGADANPDMVEPAIASIREALDLPPLN
jgi:hypothetical protein